MQKGFSAILVIVGLAIIVALGGGLYYANRLNAPKAQPQDSVSVVQSSPSITPNYQQPSPSSQPSVSNSEIATWKTYKNTKRGFTFKYPSSLFVIPGKVDEFVILSDKETTDWSTSKGTKMQISVLANPKNLSVQDYFNSLPKVPNTHPRTITYQQTTINGNEAVIATVSGCEEWEGCDPSKPSYEKYIKGSTYILRFNSDSWEDSWVNTLFSTFKFTQ